MLYFVIGAITGSFLNVVSIRLPRGQSIVSPRSHCLSCKKQIPFYLNIPIISYIILKGRCSNCNCKISKQSILVEILVGILFYLVFSLFSIEEAILLSVVYSCLVVISIIDLYYLLIPAYIILILYASIFPKIIIFEGNIINALYGAMVSLLYLGLPALFIGIIKKNRSVLGFGDILLSIFIGAWMGATNAVLCLFLASLIGIIFVIYFSVISRTNESRKIPFGTCISISFTLIILIEKYYNIKLLSF